MLNDDNGHQKHTAIRIDSDEPSDDVLPRRSKDELNINNEGRSEANPRRSLIGQRVANYSNFSHNAFLAARDIGRQGFSTQMFDELHHDSSTAVRVVEKNHLRTKSNSAGEQGHRWPLSISNHVN